MGLTHYEVLDVDPAASAETIRAAYRRLARRLHPDVGGSDEEFAAVSVAWATLSVPEDRARYDAGLEGSGADWGDEVGFGGPAPARPHAAPRPAPPEPEPVLDAFRSGPQTLPSIDDELARMPRPPRTASPWIPRVDGTPPVGIAFLAFLPLVVGGTAGGAGGALVGMVVGYVLLLFLATGLRIRSALSTPRNRRVMAGFLWGTVVGYGCLTLVALGDQITTNAVTVVAVAIGAAAVVGLLCEVHVHRIRRWLPAVTAMRERRAGAEAWNQLLGVRAYYGDRARLERGVLWVEQQPEGVWALVDVRSGRLLAHAPLEAPEAWARTLELSGVEVSLSFSNV